MIYFFLWRLDMILLKDLIPMQNPELVVETFRIQRIWQYLNEPGRDFAIITAFRQERQMATNLELQDELKKTLRSAGYGLVPVLGSYKESGKNGPANEISYIASLPKNTQIDKQLFFELGEKYNQDSVIIKDDSWFGLYHTRGNVGSQMAGFRLELDQRFPNTWQHKKMMNPEKYKHLDKVPEETKEKYKQEAQELLEKYFSMLLKGGQRGVKFAFSAPDFGVSDEFLGDKSNIDYSVKGRKVPPSMTALKNFDIRRKNAEVRRKIRNQGKNTES